MVRLFLILVALLIISMLSGYEGSHVFRTGDQSLFLMPTAYTMPEKNISLTTYALGVYQLEWSIIDRTQLGIATVIPYDEYVFQRTYTPGIKYNYFKSDNLESAFWATYTPSIKWVTIGNVVSYSKGAFSGHVAGMYTFLRDFDLEEDDFFEEEDSKSFIVMLGGMYDNSERFALYAETIFNPYNSYDEDEDEDDDEGISSTFNFGARARGRHLSIDLCFLFFYRINTENDGAAMLPLLKGSVRF